MKRVLAALALTAALAIGGCSSSDPTPTSAAAPPASASPSAVRSTPAACVGGRLANGDCAGDPSTPGPSIYNDRVAWEFCPAILQVDTSDAIYNPDKMEPLGQLAATSQHPDLALQGRLLADAARLTRQAKGSDQEVSTTLTMSGAATILATMCIKAGFKR